MSDKVYFTVVETAKLIRKVLKDKFPGQKFSVRSKSYSGGASITVSWRDGPSGKEVDAVVKPFEGAGFDGMIDLKYYVDSWLLPDGRAAFGKHGGTTGSVPPVDNPKPESGARMVHFGANFVFTNRSFSEDFLEKVSDRLSSRTGWDKVDIVVYDYDGSAYFDRTSATIPGGQHYQTLDREYTNEAHQLSEADLEKVTA